MRIHLAACLIAVSLSDGLAAEPPAALIELSPRVGTTIEPNERDYFGVFPVDGEFERAEFFARSDTIILRVVRVASGGDSISDQILSSRAFSALRHYVETYERTNIESWKRPDSPISGLLAESHEEHPARNILALTQSGETIRGRLFFADSLGVGIARSRSAICRDSLHLLRFIEADSIAILTTSKPIPWPALVGIAAGGALFGVMLERQPSGSGGYAPSQSDYNSIAMNSLVGVGVGVMGGLMIANASNGVRVTVLGDRATYHQHLGRLRRAAAHSASPPELRHPPA